MKPSTEKRLFNYALHFKKGILIGLACLVVAVALELAGPFIAKTVIDDHILGVEGSWQEVLSGNDKHTVSYQDHYYKRSDRLTETDQENGGGVTILQIGLTY